MKLSPLILILLLVGCKSIDKKIVRMSEAAPNLTESFQAQAESVAAPTPIQTIILAWNPGDYKNFTAITSDTLKKPFHYWIVFLVTTNTSFQVQPTQARQYFAVCGFSEDGQTAFATIHKSITE